MAAKRYWVNIPDVEYFRQMIKCQAACPVMTDARGYVTAIAAGNWRLATRSLMTQTLSPPSADASVERPVKKPAVGAQSVRTTSQWLSGRSKGC